MNISDGPLYSSIHPSESVMDSTFPKPALYIHSGCEPDIRNALSFESVTCVTDTSIPHVLN